jgi:hypothetical protein
MSVLLIRSFIATFLMFGVWFIFNHTLDGTVWQGMTLSKSALTAEYCEFNDTSQFFHQRMNTYSNLAYFFFGTIILQIAYSDYQRSSKFPQNHLYHFPALSALTGFCFIYLSFGSAFFHASLTWLGQRVDMNGTYSITLALIGIGLYHVRWKMNTSERLKLIWIIVLVGIILAFYKIHLWVSSGILVPLLILFTMILTGIHYFQNQNRKYLIIWVISFLLIVVAVKIRTMDVQKINCNPTSLLQGHSVWHFLTALSSFCSYAFYRFDKK